MVFKDVIKIAGESYFHNRFGYYDNFATVELSKILTAVKIWLRNILKTTKFHF